MAYNMIYVFIENAIILILLNTMVVIFTITYNSETKKVILYNTFITYNIKLYCLESTHTTSLNRIPL